MKNILGKLLSFFIASLLVFQVIAGFLNPAYLFAQESSPSPTVEASPTAGPSPSLDPSPTASATPEPSPSAIISPSPTASPTEEPSPSPTPTSEPEVLTTPTPTPNESPNPPPSSSPTPTPSVTTSSEEGQITAVLYTDQADYSPTQTAIIFGSNFKPNETYTLEITADNLDVKVDVVADENGNFAYSYQLDGTYRPNYTVQALDSSGNTVATTSFTDSPPKANLDQCRNGTVASPNDCDSAHWVNGNAGASNAHYVEGLSIPYRAVLTDLPTSTSITVVLGYDITHGGPHAIDYLTHYQRIPETVSPTDGIAGISGPTTTFAIPAPSSAGSPVAGQPTTSFNALPAGERLMTLFGGTITGMAYVAEGSLTGATSETQISVTFTSGSSTEVLSWGGHIAAAADWGAGNSAGGISGSPYHMRTISWTLNNIGNQDRSLSADAVAAPTTATLTLVKTVTNDNGGTAVPTAWTLSASGPTPISGVTGSTAVTNAAVNQGTYTLSESGGPTGYTASTYSCVNNGGGAVVSNSITLAPNDIATCTITNDDQPAHLTVNKIIIPPPFLAQDPGKFDLLVDTAVKAVGIGDSAPGNDIDGTTGQFEIDAGTHTISEQGVDGTDLAGYSGEITCDNVTVNQTDIGAGEITLVNGVGTVCTITNISGVPQGSGTVVINKVTEGGDGEFNYTSSSTVPGTLIDPNSGLPDSDADPSNGIDGNFSITTFGGVGSQTLSPATAPEFPANVLVTEGSLPAGWVFKSLTCDQGSDPNSSSSVSNQQATIVVAEGDTVTCTYTNTKKGHIIVDKVTDPSEDPQSFSFDASGGDYADFSLTDIATPNDQELVPGTYSVTETVPAGWDQTGATCDNQQTPGNINLAAGQTVHCTFENAKLATINLVKNTVGGNGDFDFDATGTGLPEDIDLTTVDGTASQTFDNLNPDNTYSIAENTPAGWVLSSPSCNNGDPVNSITPNAGEVITCTFTNTKQPKLTVHKVVINHGEDKTSANFAPYKVDDTTVTLDTPTIFSIGSYTVTEATDSNYTATFSEDCNGSGVVTLAAGDNKTCTITNEERPSKLIVHKVVVNHGQQNDATHFAPYKVDSTEVALDAENTFDSGIHTVSEQIDSNYTATFSQDCNSQGSVTLVPGATKECTITNEELPATIVVHKVVVNHGLNNDAANFAPYKVGDTEVTLDSVTTIDSGTYLVSEATDSNYNASFTAGDCDGSGSLTVTPGSNKTCTITNEEKTATLTLVKTVTNNNGGTKEVSDFVLKVDGSEVTSGQANTLDSGVHGASEINLPGYAASSWGGNCAEDGSVTLNPGDNKTCTITNDDDAPTLTLNKVLVKDNGGTALESDWTLTADGPTGFSGVGPTVNNGESFDAGTYDLSESGPEGYSASAWSCQGGTQNGNAVTLGLGESATCTITNDDITPTLKLVKEVINDNGGIALAGAWDLTAAGTGGFADAGDSTTFHTVKAGVGYTLSESTISGYLASSWSCDSEGVLTDDVVTLGLNQNVTCKIENNDIQPKLTVIKHVINYNGGNASAEDFGMLVSATNASPSAFAGDELGTIVNLDAGSYSVDEIGVSGYSMSSSADCVGTIDIGETKACTITNNDQPAHIVLTKVVTNDNGGNAEPNDFDPTIDDNVVLSDSTTDVSSNTAHTINETLLSGYTFESITGDQKCPEVLGGSVTLDEGETLHCTITNNDQPAKITLIKEVKNDNGGNAGPNDFGISVDGNGVLSGSTTDVNSNTPTEINEVGLTGYNFVSITGDSKCLQVLGDTVTLDEGEHITCTIINDDIQPLLTVNKVVNNNHGGTLHPSDFPLFVGDTPVTNGVANGFNVGAYVVSETGQTGYTQTSVVCDKVPTNAVTLAVGDVKSCTITNEDIAPQLTVIKHVENLHGGNAVAGDFTMNVSGTNVSDFSFTGAEDPGTTVTLDQGEYSVDEGNETGYTKSLGNDCTGTINVGESKTCTVTNTDVAPKITLIKALDIHFGGTALASDFTLSVDGNGVTQGEVNEVTANTEHSINESSLSGYEFESITGDPKCPQVLGETVTLDEGDNIACTITNRDLPAHLTVNKIVAPPPFLAKDPGTFKLKIDGIQYGDDVTDVNPSSEIDGTTGQQPISAGSHTLSEDISGTMPGTDVPLTQDIYGGGIACEGPGFTLPDPDFNQVPVDITLENGAEVVCTIENLNGVAQGIGQLFTVKNAIGGNDTFDFTTTSTVEPGTTIPDNSDVGPFSINTADGTTNPNLQTIQAAPGFPSHVTLTESTPPAGWDFNEVNCISDKETTDPGTGSTFTYDASKAHIKFIDEDTVICTYTNTKLPKLTVTKIVTNDNGGTKEVSDFPLAVNGDPVTSGETKTYEIGSYTVSETGDANYAATIGGACDAQGHVTLAAGDDKTCTITNDDKPAHLIVIKHVINDDLGISSASNFTMTINGVSASGGNSFPGNESGTNKTLTSIGSYNVAESGPGGYDATYSSDCTGTIGLNQTKTCTITNNDQQGRMTGGGSVFTRSGSPDLDTVNGASTNNVRVTHGFQIHCRLPDKNDNIEINWNDKTGKSHKFHMDTLTGAVCTKTGNPAPPKNTANGFNVFTGTGVGRYDGVAGATLNFIFVDNGEPGKNDTAQYLVKNSSGTTVLDVDPKKLDQGNHQAHRF